MSAIGSKEETRLYFEAVELAEAVVKAAAVLASACPSSRASGSTNATLARGLRELDLSAVHEARARCTSASSRQLASLLVLGSRHKTTCCRHVSRGCEHDSSTRGCAFFHDVRRDRRRDPMVYPTQLVMCPQNQARPHGRKSAARAACVPRHMPHSESTQRALREHTGVGDPVILL